MQCKVRALGLGETGWGSNSGAMPEERSGQCLAHKKCESIIATQSCCSYYLKFPDGVFEVSSLGRRVICDYSRELGWDKSGQVGTLRCKLISGEQHFEQPLEVLCP